jgi:hypothetical protein
MQSAGMSKGQSLSSDAPMEFALYRKHHPL